jgi:hypothetical protein
MITVYSLGLANNAPMETASSRPGIDSMTSTARMTTESTQPPNAPARVPSTRPPLNPMIVASTPTSNVCWDPISIRDSRSRPTWSPPSGCPGWDGGIWLRARMTWSPSMGTVGSCAASHGDRIARITNEEMITAPTMNTGLRRSLRHAAAVRLTPASLDAARLLSASILSERVLITYHPTWSGSADRSVRTTGRPEG